MTDTNSPSKDKGSFSFISLGCARTLVDSEHMVNDLKSAGMSMVPEGSNETVTILNTCSFIQAAIDETETNIKDLTQRKKDGHIKHLAVVGCYPSRFKKGELNLKYPEVDLWLTTQEQSQLKPRLTELLFQKKFMPSTPVKYTKLTPSHYSYIKISEGCNNWCAFCTIPKIRGEHTSIPLETIIKEAKDQISYGAKELLLVAEDTTAWGEDIYGKPSFHLLLDELAKLPIKWIRPMYIFPSRVDSDLLNVIKKHDNITNYIDMPIQHASDHLLTSMNRRHDKAYLEQLFKDFQAEIPELQWRTSLIAGFPGETEEDVDELIQFLHDYPFAQVGCFGYSYEKETRSARMEGQVDAATIQSRIERIMTAQLKLVEERNQDKVGQTLEIIYEGNQTARSQFESPEVDGSILIENHENLIPGQFYQATITSAKGYDLKATVNV
ncbi:30S ribosomal protein S12 methylthiotransferase RimO [bacterium]|nr:30S ribosomal protein S12 methylthiotransferase RimO [bacterium]